MNMSYLKLFRNNKKGIRFKCDCSLKQRASDLSLAKDYNRLQKSRSERERGSLIPHRSQM